MPQSGFTRRGLLSGLLGSGVAGGVLVRSLRAAGPSQGASGASAGDRQDWAGDSRYGADYLKINRQVIEWPGNARLAFMCSIPFESYDLGIPTDTENAFAVRDSAAISAVYYGGRAGVWRIMNVLDRHGVKGNFITNAVCAVQFPEAVRAIAQRGHEIVGHFWANNISQDSLTPERDRELSKRSLETLEQVAGTSPVSWVAPGWRLGPHSLAMLVEAGLTSHSNSPSSGDVPYVVNVGGREMVVLAHETVLNDNGFFNAFNAPSGYVDYLRRDFDAKYAEGAKRPSLFNFVLHAQLAGRPFMADALDEIIAYVKSFPNVWFTTREPVVKWWREKNYR